MRSKLRGAAVTLSAALLTGALGFQPAAAAPPKPGPNPNPASQGKTPAPERTSALAAKTVGPGRMDRALGGFVVSASDVAELSISRQHISPVPQQSRPDLAVFGPGWQAGFLGGMTSFGLEVDETAKDISVIAPNGDEHRYERVAHAVYRAADGSRIERSTRKLSHTLSSGLRFTWQQVNGTWRVTEVGTPKTGMDRVSYDDAGRVSRLTQGRAGKSGGGYAEIHYAKVSTAAGDTPGSYAGNVKRITYVAGTDAKPVTAARYGYDAYGRLRTVNDPRQNQTSTYAYDNSNRITKIDSLTYGAWKLSYPSRTAAPTATKIKKPKTMTPECPNAVDWMWGKPGCWADPVRHYGLQRPSWKTTPTGKAVVGIDYDHCTGSWDEPDGFDFKAACDMHDYGYGVIATDLMSYDQKVPVDELFYTTLRDHTCPAYSAWTRWACYADAYVYRQGVRWGDPNNGRG